MAPNRVTSPASAKGRDTPDHADVPSSQSSREKWRPMPGPQQAFFDEPSDVIYHGLRPKGLD